MGEQYLLNFENGASYENFTISQTAPVVPVKGSIRSNSSRCSLLTPYLDVASVAVPYASTSIDLQLPARLVAGLVLLVEKTGLPRVCNTVDDQFQSRHPV